MADTWVWPETEFMFFSDLVSLTVIRCGKLIGYKKARYLLHKYVSLFFLQITIIILKKYL